MARKLTWKSLLDDRRVRPHETTRRELDDLRAVVARDLRDARIPGLSADRRLATAYNAVLQLAKMAIACEGYRAAGLGHHQAALQALEVAMGREVAGLTPYFDACRHKRNQVDYDMAHAASETEANELIEKAEEFRGLVEDWIARHHPGYGLQTAP